MTRYLIADTMLFDDELYEISVLGNALKSVVLGAAASRCFSTLLEAQGAIVTKKELLRDGWERYGQQVSVNSVSQAISQIRRCLSTLELPDCVVTVPRIGYKIGDSLFVEKLHESATLLKLLSDVSDVSDVSDAVESVPSSLSVALTGGVATVKTKGRPLTFRYASMTALIVLNAVLAFTWNEFQLNSPLSTAIDFSYLPVQGTAAFSLFAAPGISVSPERISAHILKLNEAPPAFASLSSYVYLNGTLRDNVYSYFLCREPIEFNNSNCVSYLVEDESQ